MEFYERPFIRIIVEFLPPADQLRIQDVHRVFYEKFVPRAMETVKATWCEVVCAVVCRLFADHGARGLRRAILIWPRRSDRALRRRRR